MKENKKLNSKVESLTRKVQNLQTKLAAAKAATTSANSSPDLAIENKHAATSPPLANARPRATTLTSVPSPTTFSIAPPIPSPAHRIVSGPSAISRPKTPEKKSLFIFRPRSPDKQTSTPQTLPASSAAPSSNKKRPPPEDYDTMARNIPAQGFTPECIRSDAEVEASTPRVRRVFSSIQSGFTPSRHPNRPMAPLPSPRRSDAAKQPLRATHMADLTNNVSTVPQVPQMASVEEDKSSKRSWLGKIRGASQVPAVTRARGDRPRAL
jgi:hypothetical protein